MRKQGLQLNPDKNRSDLVPCYPSAGPAANHITVAASWNLYVHCSSSRFNYWCWPINAHTSNVNSCCMFRRIASADTSVCSWKPLITSRVTWWWVSWIAWSVPGDLYKATQLALNAVAGCFPFASIQRNCSGTLWFTHRCRSICSLHWLLHAWQCSVKGCDK